MCMQCGCACIDDHKKDNRWNMEAGIVCSTGALMSKTSFNEGESVAGIAHAILLEGENE